MYVYVEVFVDWRESRKWGYPKKRPAKFRPFLPSPRPKVSEFVNLSPAIFAIILVICSQSHIMFIDIIETKRYFKVIFVELSWKFVKSLKPLCLLVSKRPLSANWPLSLVWSSEMTLKWRGVFDCILGLFGLLSWYLILSNMDMYSKFWYLRCNCYQMFSYQESDWATSFTDEIWLLNPGSPVSSSPWQITLKVPL